MSCFYLFIFCTVLPNIKLNCISPSLYPINIEKSTKLMAATNLNTLGQKVQQRLGLLWIYLNVWLEVQLGRAVALNGAEIRENHSFFFIVDCKGLGMLKEEFPEFVEMLPRYVTYFRTGLRSMTQEAADGDFSTFAILGEFFGEVLHSLGVVVFTTYKVQ